MEFWGLEVKPGTTVKCEPGDGFILHLSQAALGESKKSDNALMYVKVDDQKIAIGTLSIDKYPQQQFDLIFDKEFELTHLSKTTSVFFTGYKVEQPMEEDEMDLDSEEDEEINIPVINANANKADGKEEQKSQGKDDDDDDLSDDTSNEEEQETSPKKPEAGKKRATENALKNPLSDKKAKIATLSAQKTGGKKGATHVAAPYPAKQAGKTPANNDKSKDKSPRSGGLVPSKSCSKCNTFKSEMALQAAHSKVQVSLERKW